MSQVVNLDEVEVVLTPYQIRPPIGPFNPLLISLSTAISAGSSAKEKGYTWTHPVLPVRLAVQAHKT